MSAEKADRGEREVHHRDQRHAQDALVKVHHSQNQSGPWRIARTSAGFQQSRQRAAILQSRGCEHFLS
jgi:hypothetical protein